MKFKKNKKDVQNNQVNNESIDSFYDNKKNVSGPIKKGSRNLIDFLAPNGIDRSNPDYLVVGGKYIKSFGLTGYPNFAQIGWLKNLYDSTVDFDTALYINPSDERRSLDEIIMKITQLEAQLMTEYESGSIKNISKLTADIRKLQAQRENLEQNYDKMFHMSLITNLYCNDKKALDKESQIIETKFKGSRIVLSPSYLRQDESYKSALPFGINYLEDIRRNVNTGALIASFPFYNSEISHVNGIFIGRNLLTNTPVILDLYDRSLLFNSNMTVIGQSGSGKTFGVALIIMRSAVRGIRTACVDPEGENINLTKALGGTVIELSANSKNIPNPFDIEEEEERDGSKTVDIKSKTADLINLIAVMAGGLGSEEKSVVSTVITDLYKGFGITENPESLYEEGNRYNPETESFEVYGKKKRMPRFSDFYVKLEEYNNLHQLESIKKLIHSLKMFKEGNTYDLFDCQTPDELLEFKDAPIITFDVSKLEESVLRPIGMYVALTWIWEKFVKKNPHIKKRVVVDEAWMLVNKNMEGSEFTAKFLEVAARRIRKRNGGLLVASQGFQEFARSPQGEAVVKNSAVTILLKSSPTDVDALQNVYKLSDGEKNFLMSAKRGTALMKIGEETAVIGFIPFEYEEQLIKSTYKPKDA